MSIQFELLESEVLNLSTSERSRLLDRLVASLEVDAEIQLAWENEAERRDAEIDSGSVTVVSIEEVLARLHAELQ